jgi:penicillin-binding protein 1A
VDAWLDGYTPKYSTVVWMGYPTKRVSMTSVHGQLQQGGALPSVIWKTYMSAVTEHEPCAEFPTPKEPISYQAFFGKFASTGQSVQASENSEENASKKEKKHGKQGKPQRTASPGGGGSNTGGGPSTPPTPHTAPPSEPPSPPPGSGGGATGGAAPH